MQNQLYTTPESNYQGILPDLHNIFSERQIVQSYNHKGPNSIFIQTRQRRQHQSYQSSQMMLEHQHVESQYRKPKKFIEDDLLQELHNGNIVENYMMDEEKEQSCDPNDNMFKSKASKPAYLNANMLASSSQNNDVPSRNSSLSSLSEKNHLININANKSFLDDDMIDAKHKINHVKKPQIQGKKAHNHHNARNYHCKANSQNEMDLQNSPFQRQSSLCANNHQLNYHRNNNNFYIAPNNLTNIPICNNNLFVPPQNKSAIPTFRRMDIDEQRQKRQKMLKIQKIQQMGCNCKKSKCLKMYCECFNLQIFCNENCNCVGCCNQESNQEHKKAVLDALTRNPRAFHETTQKLEVTFELGVQLAEVKKGCKCKKTRCQKKYCECFNIGEKCGKFCKCEGCQNC